MAVSHLNFNDQSQHGRIQRRALQSLEEGLENLNDTIATMVMMRDGDGSQAVHYAYATTKYGYTNDAATKAAFDELNSLALKLNTNASVTDVNNALLNAFSKFR